MQVGFQQAASSRQHVGSLSCHQYSSAAIVQHTPFQQIGTCKRQQNIFRRHSITKFFCYTKCQQSVGSQQWGPKQSMGSPSSPKFWTQPFLGLLRRICRASAKAVRQFRRLYLVGLRPVALCKR